MACREICRRFIWASYRVPQSGKQSVKSFSCVRRYTVKAVNFSHRLCGSDLLRSGPQPFNKVTVTFASAPKTRHGQEVTVTFFCKEYHYSSPKLNTFCKEI